MRQITVRVDEEDAKWLEEHENVSKFVAELIHRARENAEAQKVETKVESGWPQLYASLPEKVQALFDKRRALFESVAEIERIYQIERFMRILLSKYQWEPEQLNEYALLIEKLDDAEYEAFKNAIPLHDLEMEPIIERKRFNGNPDEVVYAKKNITRRMIYSSFDKSYSYSTSEIAGKFGITYMEAFNHLKPWMLADGWQIKDERKTDSE